MYFYIRGTSRRLFPPDIVESASQSYADNKGHHDSINHTIFECPGTSLLTLCLNIFLAAGMVPYLQAIIEELLRRVRCLLGGGG